jgi:EpsI family protein
MKAPAVSVGDPSAAHRTPLAAVIAVAVLLTAGTAYRLAADYYGRDPQSAALPAGALDRLPLELSEWFGREIPMDERIIKATDTDAHLNRAYLRGVGERVGLWIGYGARMRDLLPHRPEVCMPGAGWTPDDRRVVDVPCADGTMLPAQIHCFHRGGLDGERIVVLNFYIVDGQLSPDVALLRAQAARVASGPRYSAQVQINAMPTDGSIESAEKSARDFAAQVGPAIRTLLTQTLDRDAPPGERP